MASIVRQNVGANTYLYESVSYRNEQGKPRNRRVPIGKIDRRTGLPVYKPEYIARMADEGVVVESAGIDPVFSEEDVRRSTILQTGLIRLLHGSARNIGLSAVLQETFPQLHEQIFAIASFLFACGDPVAYCADWIERSDIDGVGTLSSQRISEILRAIRAEDRQRFFAAWSRCRRDREYLALDITSISSWSQLIDDVEWGYNRDGDELAQINLCMLMGQQSRLPVRMSVYNGSINDVRTLETTVAQVASEEADRVVLVMDRGFSSTANIEMLLQRRLSFLLALPLTMSFTKQQIDDERADIDRFANTIVHGEQTLRAITKKRAWANGKDLFVHVYFNDARYLTVNESKQHKKGHEVSVREEVLAQELRYTGWVVLLSNVIDNAEEALRIYRDKDVIEKGFDRLKNSFGMDRLRVHSQDAMENKLFIGFIALILSSHVHRAMLDENLYTHMTVKDLIRMMEQLRIQIIGGKRVLFPTTKRQREIFEAFALDPSR